MKISPDGIYNREFWGRIHIPAFSIGSSGIGNNADRASGTNTLLFDGTAAETCRGQFKLPLDWKPGTPIVPQITWARTTASSAPVYWYIVFDVVDIGTGTSFSFPDSYDFSIDSDVASDDAVDEEHLVYTAGEVSTSGHDTLTTWHWIIVRDPTDAADTYTSDARLICFDIYYKLDSPGGRKQYEK